MASSDAIPRIIAFEGVDGAGKSTVIAKVAAQLRAQGHSVHLPRTGKEHDSRPTRMIRRLTRDPRNLALSSISEFLLYCAREMQILQEEVGPALSRNEIVLLDRSLLTPEVMARYGRGLDPEAIKGVLGALPSDLQPELTMVFEVHPRTSRIRKRLAKVREQGPRDPGRKGLSGSAFKERVRAGYIETAGERGFAHFCVEAMTPDELAHQVMRCIQGQGVERSGKGESPRWLVDPGLTLAQALDSLEEQDPAMALYFSRGLIGARERRARWLEQEPELVAWSLDPADPLETRALELRPRIVLRQMAFRPLGGEEDPRVRWALQEPEAVLLGLRGVHGPKADALRAKLLEVAPGSVVESLAGREYRDAQALRNAGWKEADVFERAQSLCGCVSAKNQRRRNKIAASWPHLAASSMRGVPPELADALLHRVKAKAPKAVLSALIGRQDEQAAQLRLDLTETGREVIDGIRGLDDARSWALREAHLERWPSTVAWSLWGVGASEEREAMLERCRALAPGDLHMLRRLALFEQAPELPDWAWPRRGQELAGDAF